VCRGEVIWDFEEQAVEKKRGGRSDRGGVMIFFK
jgi:hypothetical protein